VGARARLRRLERGSGAAVAADLVPGALGTDTAGSVRIPACFCGVTGLRPSIGLVSNDGVVPVSWTFDTVGPLARTAEDCSLLLEALAPAIARDRRVEGLRVGLVEELFDRAEPEIAARARAAVAELESLGARVEPASAPMLEESGRSSRRSCCPRPPGPPCVDAVEAP